MLAFERLEVLGADYEQLNAAELKERLEYGWLDERAREQAATPLFFPFARRPRLGARLRARDHFRRLVGTITAEMRAWQTAGRAPSARLLSVLMVYQEVSAAAAHAARARARPLVAAA